MDKTDEKILKLLQGNARMSCQKIGEAVGMSRVAVKKRIRKLEKDGVIRGYNTCIYRENEVTMFMDIVTVPEKFDEVLKYVSTGTAFIRQIFRTTKKDHIHIVAVSDDVRDLKYLTKMIEKQYGNDIVELHCHAVKEIVKDVYGGIFYGQKTGEDADGDHG